jgi:hypothetical protein
MRRPRIAPSTIAFSGCPVVFESDKNGFLLDESVLSYKPPPSPAYTREILTAHAEGTTRQAGTLEVDQGARGEVLLMPGPQGRRREHEDDCRQAGSQPADAFSQVESGGSDLRESSG